MASCTTTQWASTSPQIRLTVTETSSTNASVTLTWTLQYIASSAAQTSNLRTYSATIGGSTVSSGSYSINGRTGTNTIASGTKVINKTTSAQTISFGCSMAFNLTWSGAYSGTRSASGSITVAKKPSYTITYNANGGSGAPSKQTKWYGTTLKLSSSKPTRSGHTFLGWSTSSTATTAKWKAGDPYTDDASDVLYAVWKVNTYFITYNANGGTGGPTIRQAKTHGVNENLWKNTPTRSGYNFIGWGTSSTATKPAYQPGGLYTANSDITLYALWEVAYIKPKVTNFTVDRCNSAGAGSDGGTYAKVMFDWECDNNVSSIKIEWKASTATTYVNTTVAASGKSGSVNQIIGAGALDAEMLYNIRVTVADAGGSSSSSKNLAQMSYIIDFLPNGGIAVGKPAELQDYLDVMYKARFRKDVFLDNGTFLNAYALRFYISEIATPGSYTPYFKRGDAFSILWRGAGYLTNAGKEVWFTLPLSKPVIGSPNVSITTVNGFVLRQGNKYTHGSAASTWAKPDSYVADLQDQLYVIVKAVFTNVTNITNNDAIGIHWSGRITFS